MKKILLIISAMIIYIAPIKAQDKKSPYPIKDSTNQYYEGRRAYFHSVNKLKNPYTGKDSVQWIIGWKNGEKEAKNYKKLHYVGE